MQPAWQAFEREGEGNQGARSRAREEGGSRRRREVPFLSPSRAPKFPLPLPLSTPTTQAKKDRVPLSTPPLACVAGVETGRGQGGREKRGGLGREGFSLPPPPSLFAPATQVTPSLVVTFSFSSPLAIATIRTHGLCYERHMLITEEVGILSTSRLNRRLF